MNFLNQYQQAGGNAKLIGGSIMVDQTVLSSKGKAKDALIGTIAASAWPTPGTTRNGRRSSKPIRTPDRLKKLSPARRSRHQLLRQTDAAL